VKFGIRGLHFILLSICEFRENFLRKVDTFLMGIITIKFICINFSALWSMDIRSVLGVRKGHGGKAMCSLGFIIKCRWNFGWSCG